MKKSPAVSARIPSVTQTVSAPGADGSGAGPPGGGRRRLFIERRISPLVNAAMAKSRYSARNRKKLKLTERIAAASSSRNAIVAVYR